MLNSRLVLAVAGMIGLTATQSIAALSKVDQDFVQKAAAGGMAEVSMGQLAQQNATSPQIKQFAEKIVADHTQGNQELQQIAQQENLTLPTAPNSKDQAAQKRLSAMKGPAFDTAFAKYEVQDHRQDIAEFQREARSGQDPALKAFAQKTLPVLRQHLQMAEAAASAK
jgi:putative membrane protein